MSSREAYNDSLHPPGNSRRLEIKTEISRTALLVLSKYSGACQNTSEPISFHHMLSSLRHSTELVAINGLDALLEGPWRQNHQETTGLIRYVPPTMLGSPWNGTLVMFTFSQNHLSCCFHLCMKFQKTHRHVHAGRG